VPRLWPLQAKLSPLAALLTVPLTRVLLVEGLGMLLLEVLRVDVLRVELLVSAVRMGAWPRHHVVVRTCRLSRSDTLGRAGELFRIDQASGGNASLLSQTKLHAAGPATAPILPDYRLGALGPPTCLTEGICIQYPRPGYERVPPPLPFQHVSNL